MLNELCCKCHVTDRPEHDKTTHAAKMPRAQEPLVCLGLTRGLYAHCATRLLSVQPKYTVHRWHVASGSAKDLPGHSVQLVGMLEFARAKDVPKVLEARLCELHFQHWQ